MTAGQAKAATVQREPAGLLADGTEAEAVTLAVAGGLSARILTYGATLQSVLAPDRNGILDEVTLGFDDLASYEHHQSYFGVTIGRYANRIAGGHFTIDDVEFQLARNDGDNSLHGGGGGFDRRNWAVAEVEDGESASVTLSLTSADGEMGYPGTLTTRATFSLSHEGSLEIVMEATSDQPTIVNMTNHAFFNLSGHDADGGAMGQWLKIPARLFLPVDAGLIPTGELRSVAGGAFDFTAGRTLERDLRDGRDPQIALARGYDHNFVLDKGLTAEPELAATLASPQSGRVLEVFTTEPGLQVYTGNFLDGTITGRGGRLYRMGDGVALEPQKFPDTPNQPAFGSARINPGETYRHAMIYRFSVRQGSAPRL